METNWKSFSSKLCQGKILFECGMVTRWNLLSSKSGAEQPGTVRPPKRPVGVLRQAPAGGSARRRGLGCRGRLPESRAAHSRRAGLEKTSSVKHIHKWEWRSEEHTSE